MSRFVLVDSDEHAAWRKLRGSFDTMACSAERCVHERVLWFKLQLLEALGEQNGNMPIFVSQCARAWLFMEE